MALPSAMLPQAKARSNSVQTTMKRTISVNDKTMNAQTTTIVPEVAVLVEAYEFFPSDGAYLEGESVAVEFVPVPIGGSRVAHLEFKLIPPGEYPAMNLRLYQAGKGDRQIVRETQTSSAGQAMLRFVLMDVSCGVEVLPVEHREDPTFSASS